MVKPLPSKEVARGWGRLRRASLSAPERKRHSIAASKRCLKVIGDHFPKADMQKLCVAVYLPVFDELDLQHFIDTWQGDLALPSTERSDKRLIFRRYSKADTLIIRRGLLSEPGSDSPEVKPGVVIVPLLVFDDKLNRMGYGQGWYDRTLTSAKERGALCIGVAFDCQRNAKVPTEDHDIPLDLCVTEKGVWR